MSAIWVALGSTTALFLLGAIQGATEFLPVSSSGHLIIFGHWFGLESGEGLSREIALHFGTLLAVILFCRRDIISMLSAGSSGLWKLVLGASVVTAGLGIPLKDKISSDLSEPFTAGWFLLGTTFLLVVLAPRSDEKLTRQIGQGTWSHALILGLFQSLALAPGISRAGATLVGALLLGYGRQDAVRIAFLISIPAVGGAVLLDAWQGHALELAREPDILSAMLVAFLVGILALRFIAVHVDAPSLRKFGYYTGLLGVAAILTA